MKNSQSSLPVQEEYKCEFCDKTFVREGSLIAHSCVKKMRWIDRNTKNSVIAFVAYKRFYELTNAKKAKNITQMDFINSKFYSDFAKFGKWVNDNLVVSPNQYIDYVIKNSIKLKDWGTSPVYKEFLKLHLLKEEPEEALERSIAWIETWCSTNDIEIKDFFNKISSVKFVDCLLKGFISPWIIFTSRRGEQFLSNLDAQQYNLIQHLLELKVWHIKLKKYQKEVNEYSNILNEAGL